jgi:peptidoglycan/LPS O-acetylase OafA/YrhL
MPSIQRRKDIDGLRAIAVMSVVIFHFNPQWLPGGFAGVDIFFVISGYLMTSIIMNGMDNGNFSFKKFYTSRVKRIIPALIAVVLFTSIIGFVSLDVTSYKMLGKHMLSSMSFISNYVYAFESGYFDSDSKSKILLHTWSLSVEWQFYILFPIFLYLVKNRSNRVVLIYSIFVLSLALSIYQAFNHSKFAYYSLPGRSWQMMGGAIVYVINKKLKLNRIGEIFGVVLILLSFIIYNDTMAWPGVNAIVPVVGAMLVIHSGMNENSFFRNRVIQYIGIISYSIYLVHWPVIVFFRKLNIEVGLFFYLFIVFTLSLILHHLVESKVKNINIILFSYIFMMLISSSIFYAGAPSRISSKVDTSYGGHRLFGKANGKILHLNESSKQDGIIFVGDSYSQQFIDFIDSEGINATFISLVSCPILPDYYAKEESGCYSMYEKAINEINKSKSNTIILAHNWERYNDKLISRHGDYVSKSSYNNVILSQINKWRQLINKDKRMYVIGNYQHPNYDVVSCMNGNRLPVRHILDGCKNLVDIKSTKLDDLFIENSGDGLASYKIINPKDELCKNGKCMVIHNDKPVYFDGGHLSSDGSKIVGKYLLSKIN